MRMPLMVRTTRESEGVAILGIGETAMFSEGSAALQVKVWELLESGELAILLDMSDVGELDSSNIGDLVASHVSIVNAGGQMKLLNVSPGLREVLCSLHLDSVFETIKDEEIAIQSLQPFRVSPRERHSELFLG